MRIAIPTNSPGVLDAERSGHWDHCDIFTMIEFAEQKAIIALTTVQNGDHEAGGCTVPVKTLQDAVAEAIIVGGIGKAYARLYRCGHHLQFVNRNSMTTVQEVVYGLTINTLPVKRTDQACRGLGNWQH